MVTEGRRTGEVSSTTPAATGDRHVPPPPFLGVSQFEVDAEGGREGEKKKRMNSLVGEERAVAASLFYSSVQRRY